MYIDRGMHNYYLTFKTAPEHLCRALEAWESHDNFESCFQGNLELDEAYYITNNGNYKTLLTDILPALNEYTYTKADINILLSCDKNINKPLIEYIQLLNITNINFVYADAVKSVGNIKRLPVKWYGAGKETFFDLRWLLRLRGLVSIPFNFKKIAIQRKKDRYLPSDVVNFLRAEGFVFFILEDMAVQDQINLFAGAEQIVGMHGAGISNSVYCKTNCKILEISCGFNIHYYADYINEITQTLPDINIRHNVLHNYKAVPEEYIASTSNRHRKFKYRNMPPEVDMSQFVATYKDFFLQ